MTPQMVLNFLRGGAAINVLARHIGARVVIVDMGVALDFAPDADLVSKKIAFGTRDFSRGPAMTRDEAQRAVEAGIQVAWREIDKGADMLATGDMGIGNTTPSQRHRRRVQQAAGG
jgi:nicotinate-nucleotide--dimethylbenzimidazole phosphoribosyltransferase